VPESEDIDMRYKLRFSLFFFAMALFNLASNFVHPVTPTLIQDLNLPDYMFGLMLAVMMISQFLLSPFWGKINASISSRQTLLVCCGGYGAAQMMFALAQTQTGILAGYNVVDFKVTLYDGSYHEVDSSEMAFKIAGSMAFKEAMRKADPVLTEPVMKVTVVTPDDYLGDVIGDINSRRGTIVSMDAVSGAQQITAHVPLSDMFGYATELRSRTQGRGVYSMEPSHFAEVPKSIQEKIVSASAKN
jgi:hypothetical protein